MAVWSGRAGQGFHNTKKIVVTLHNIYIPWLIPNPKLCLVRFIYP